MPVCACVRAYVRVFACVCVHAHAPMCMAKCCLLILVYSC